MKKHIHKKHESIRAEFHKLYEKGYRAEVIYKQLAERYFHSELTIEQIVWQRGGYTPAGRPKKTDPNQIDLFG